MKIKKMMCVLLSVTMLYCYFGDLCLNKSDESSKYIIAHATGYDPSAATAYAEQYWSDYNPDYSNYNSIGGDCANFVSQCLHAGGLELTDGWYWYSYSDRSASWASCSDMYRYFDDAGYTIIENPSDDQVLEGNPVLYWRDGRWGHAAICVGESNGTPVVAAHNNNRWRVNWTLGYSKTCTIMIPSSSPKWYDNLTPVNLGSFYGKISNQSNGLYFTDTGSTVVGQTASNDSNQIWRFEHQSDGSYKITNHSNGYPMDIAGADTVDGTDVRTWADDNGSSAQRFFIYNIWGSYYIRPLCSDLPLDMSLGTDDHNIATWGYGAEWAPQMFDIEKIDVNGFLPVNIGDSFVARIKNQSNNMYFTDTGSTIAGQAVSDSASQLWKFEYQNNGSYKIICQSNAKPIDIAGAATDDNTDVRTWSDNGLSAQRFYIYRAYDSYYFKPLCSDKMLDMSLGTDDHNVATWGFGADWAPQKFDIEKVDVNGFVPVNIGESFLATIKNQSSDLYFTNTGSTIEGQKKSESKSQLWKFEYQNNGSYKIISQLDNKPMDIAGAATDNNTDVRTWSDNGLPAQRFYIYRAYDSYYLRPLCSDKMVDMGIGTDDHNVATWGFGADWDPQKFDIDKVLPTISNLNASKKSVIIGESIVFTATSDYATGYTIGIDKEGERLITKEMPNGKLSLVFDKPGVYSAYVTSYNSEGYVDSERISITVKSEITLQNGEQYTLPIDNSDHTFKSHNDEVAIISKKGVITAIGEGSAKISIINDEADVVQITIKVIKPFISGDCNSDGEFNISDVVLLQKWLLAVPDTHIENWKAADMCEDDRLDIFDLCMMKRKLIYG